MDLKRIQDLISLVASSDVAEVEVEEDGVKIIVRKQLPTVVVQSAAPSFPPMGYPAYAPMPGYPVPAPPGVSPASPSAASVPPAANGTGTSPAEESPAPVVEKTTVVKAPIVGTFYSAPSPDSEPFVKPGDSVKVGDTLCIIEAMKLMNEIESEVTGTVREVLIQNGQPVEFDQPLFKILPA